MDQLQAIRAFLRVADTASFSEAARAMGVTQSTVSKQVAALESRLGAQLLRRSSRGFSVTEAGQEYYDATLRLLGDLDAAESRIGRGQVAPSGTVRAAVSAGFGRMYVVPHLPAFFARYPEVRVDLHISERHVNLVEDGIDVAIPIGNLSDSSLVGRRIGSVEMITVATAAYLERYGEPKTPSEIDGRPCVVFMFHGGPRPWQFKGPSGPIVVEPKGLLRTNDAEHIRAAVLADLGLAHVASWLFADELASGQVVRVLKDHTPAPYPIHAVSPGTRRPPSKVQVFVSFMEEIFDADPHLKMR